MTSAEAVKNEIQRFLRSPEPEVLCITGAWGVGKTYTWQSILDRVRGKRETGLSRYSYVSLFGIGSLEGMKAAIFENMEFLLPEGSTGLERIHRFSWIVPLIRGKELPDYARYCGEYYTSERVTENLEFLVKGVQTLVARHPQVESSLPSKGPSRRRK